MEFRTGRGWTFTLFSWAGNLGKGEENDSTLYDTRNESAYYESSLS